MKRHPVHLVAAPLLCAAVAVGAACSSAPELEFADWMLPVPEGTPIKEYAPVSPGERDAGAVQLVEDLVIGADLSNPDAILYQPSAVVASADGNIFVADRGANAIKMFAADGQYMKTLGGPGQGPGEFDRLTTMTIAGDKLVANDMGNRRFSVWTLDGEHVTDHAPASPMLSFVATMEGLADGAIVAMSMETNEDFSSAWILSRRTIEGEELTRFVDLARPRPDLGAGREPIQLLQRSLEGMNDANLMSAVATGEVVFASPAQEYQVLAHSASGEMLWALRVAWPRPAFSEVMKQTLFDSFAENFELGEEATVNDLDWPDTTASVTALATDGAGNLYVFPVAAIDSAEPPEERLVDVYSPTGEHIASGVVPSVWRYARGVYVYGLRTNDLDEQEVVRYRIVLSED